MVRLCVIGALVVCLSFFCPAQSRVYYPEQEVRVPDLPLLTARSPHASDVLAAALATVLHDKEMCCGKDSALEASVEAADPKSLKEVAGKLEGRHLLSDGRPIAATVEYLPPDQVNVGHLIYMLGEKHAAVMMWNSRAYVMYGVTYTQTADDSGAIIPYAIHKFLLWDTRYSDARREVVFDRDTEDLSKVQGLLFVDAKLQ